MESEHKPIKPYIDQPRIDHPINVKIPDECLDPDGGTCPHDKKPIKKDFNPV